MQAIVLVGGMGPRLRPLTDSVPKPALTLVDRPFLAYMVEWLGSPGGGEGGFGRGVLPRRLRAALRGGGGGSFRLRLPPRSSARGARRGGARGSGPHLRGRARAARHRRGDPLRRRS